MSRLVSRILLSLFVFPLGAIAFVCAVMLLERKYRGSDAEMISIVMTVTWLVTAAYWVAIWRNAIVWNRRRVVSTLVSVAGSAGVGLLLAWMYFGFLGLSYQADTQVVVLGGTLAIVFWLISTVLIWRETTAERVARVANASKTAITCPACGYNLTGLNQAQCPECGATFTLDELLATQSSTQADLA